MKLFHIVLAAAFAVAGATHVAGAATYNALIQYQNAICGAYQPGKTYANTGTCDVDETESGFYGDYEVEFHATARADTGDVGVAASLAVDGTGVTAGAGIWSGQASAYFSDTLEFGISSGIFRMVVDLYGTQSATYTNTNVQAVESRVSASVSWSSGTQSSAVEVYYNGVTERPNSPVTETAGALGSTILYLPFSNGRLNVTLGLTTYLRCYYSGAGNVCAADSTGFLNSMRVIGSDVTDAAGTVIETSVVAESGFDYLTGLEPHGPVGEVPLPAAGLLLAGGFGLLGALGRRRRG